MSKTTIDALRVLETLHGNKSKHQRDREAEISDLIADLLHLAAESELDYCQILQNAWRHFDTEQDLRNPEALKPLWLCYDSDSFESETAFYCGSCAEAHEGVTEAEMQKALDESGALELSDYSCATCGKKPDKAGKAYSLVDAL